MPLTNDDRVRLERKAHELRLLTLDTTMWAGSGHIGGALSAMDALTLLYHQYLDVDPKDPAKPDRDICIVSKGHIGVGYAPVLADKGFIDRELLKTYNHTGSSLGMHLDSRKVAGVETSTGSLGHGLSLGLGWSLGLKLRKSGSRVWVIMGDGELDEGSVWEAAMAAAHHKADNLIAIVDRNKCMIDGDTEEVMALEPLADKWKAFGWEVFGAAGHDLVDLARAFDAALAVKGKPSVVIMDTVKGYGIDFMAGDYHWHYGAIDASKAAEARASLERTYEKRAAAIGKGE